MVNTGPDEPPRGSEYPALENTPATVDPYAPVDYPTDPGATLGNPALNNPALNNPAYQQPNYSPPGYQGFESTPPAYPTPDYANAGYPQMGYPPPPPGYPPQYPSGPYGYNPYSDPYADPYASARPTGTNGKAIAALVTSLVGLMLCGVPSLVGLILGVVAMRETKRTGQEGHGLALAGVIVGALAVVGWVIYVAFILFAIAVSRPYGY